MTRTILLGVLLLAPCVCHGEDASLDTAGAPMWIKMLPKPAPVPYQFPDGNERFRRYASETFGVNSLLGAGVGAGFSQWLDSPTEWGQGAEGYGRRFANSLGNTYLRNTMVHGLAAAFKEDIRYVRSGRTTVKGRLGYVLASPVVAHNRDGDLRFSAARFIGGAANAGITRTWAPASWHGWGHASRNYGYWLLTEMGYNFAREFFPDMLRRFKKR